MAFDPELAEKPEQAVGGLLRLAGRRVPPPQERARRVRAAVHAQWRRSVRARRLRRAALWTGLAAAAACAAWLAVDLSGPLHRDAGAPPPAARPARLAKVERLSGHVRLAGRAAARGLSSLAAGDEVAAGAVVESGSGGRAALRLHGGSSLRIDAETRLRLVSAAEVFLEQGAVYVDSDPGRESATVTVRTRFVRVREGRIGLDHAAGAAEGAAGEELRLQDGRVSRRLVPRHGPEWGWVQQIAPAFELDGESLGRFLAWVSRETGRPVRLTGPTDESAARTRLRGSIAGLSPEDALSAVLPTCGRTHWYEGGAILVGRRARGGAGAGGRIQ